MPTRRRSALPSGSGSSSSGLNNANQELLCLYCHSHDPALRRPHGKGRNGMQFAKEGLANDGWLSACSPALAH